MNKRFRIVISLVSAVVASMCFFMYVQNVRAEADKARVESIQKYGGELTSILVASKQIEPGETLSSTNTQVKSWVSDLIPEGAITNPESVMGRTVSSVIGTGMPVVSLHLRSSASQISIPENLVGLTISHGEKYGLSERLNAGIKLAAYEVTDSLITCIASDISVLSNNEEGSVYTSSVTLGLLPEQVPQVLSAYARGTLRFALPGSNINAKDLLENIPSNEKELPEEQGNNQQTSNPPAHEISTSPATEESHTDVGNQSENNDGGNTSSGEKQNPVTEGE